MGDVIYLADLENIGPKSTAWLNEIGVYTLSDLEEIGPIEAYRQIRDRGHPATLNLVYGIQGAIINCPWNHLPPDIRARLRDQVTALKEEKTNG